MASTILPCYLGPSCCPIAKFPCAEECPLPVPEAGRDVMLVLGLLIVT